MNNLWTKLKAWFKPSKLVIKPTQSRPVKPFNAEHYRKLIGKIARQAIAEQRARKRRAKC